MGGRSVRRSIVIELVGGCLVAAYFVAASIAMQATLFGTQTSAHDRARSLALQQAAGLAVVAAVVLACAVGGLASREQGRCDRTDTESTFPMLLTLMWVLSVPVAVVAVSAVGNDSKPVAFGWIWLGIGGLVGPVVVAGAGALRERNRGSSRPATGSG